MAKNENNIKHVRDILSNSNITLNLETLKEAEKLISAGNTPDQAANYIKENFYYGNRT